ncbi:Uncharacterized membrane protein [Methylomagnum ishizawai]|uniref:Uncharacterized membrane protein n=1 Tax=Methylomagnum ishizawai TaxID=1760988 RepID=A0A1Y6CXL7_9GAMM|nr:hypothetical protein [Methylomagnum ishizawai]SMF93303.1 Uncharacterized membrane protein [Methylomagnum ishizawai]
MAQARLPLFTALALGFPLLSFALLQSGLLPPVWLGLPNGVLALGLLLGLCVEGAAWVRAVAIGMGAGLASAGLALWPGDAVAVFPVVVNLLVGWLFLSTLRRGHEPLITRIARLARNGEPMADALLLYTRRLTAAWAGLFCLLALNATALAVFTSTRTVVLFGNTLDYALMALFFLGEYLYRRRRYRDYRHVGLSQVIRTLLRHGWLARENPPAPRTDAVSQRS